MTSAPFVAPGIGTWVLFGIVTVIGLVGTTLYASSVGRVGARRAALLFAMIPALADIGTWAILGEPLDATIVAALALGCVACVIDVAGERRGGSRASAESVARAGQRDSVAADCARLGSVRCAGEETPASPPRSNPE